MGHSWDGVRTKTVLRTTRPDGTPVYGYVESPGMPPVHLVRMDPDVERVLLERDHRHAHDFHVLLYVERALGRIRVGDRYVDLRDGGLYGVPPGEVIGAEEFHARHGQAWSVAFTPGALAPLASVSPLAWDHHPLLSIFAGGGADVEVPEAERGRWRSWVDDLATELHEVGRLGAYDAAAAVLTRMLVASARLAPTPSRGLDPLVERVFDTIEAGYADPISASDVARSLGYTPGHLTTVVRERTGRTLLDWIVERRLTEARRLLRDTDLPLGAIATRTGFGDAGYLVRRFRRRYGITPERWRRGQRGAGPV